MMDRLGLIPPDAGLLSPHVERAFLIAMADTGHDTMRVADKFAFTATDPPITRMIGQARVPGHGMIAAMDGSALLVTHWDSCCSFLCRKGETQPIPGLETFPCTARTHVYLGLYPVRNPGPGNPVPWRAERAITCVFRPLGAAGDMSRLDGTPIIAPNDRVARRIELTPRPMVS